MARVAQVTQVTHHSAEESKRAPSFCIILHQALRASQQQAVDCAVNIIARVLDLLTRCESSGETAAPGCSGKTTTRWCQLVTRPVPVLSGGGRHVCCVLDSYVLFSSSYSRFEKSPLAASGFSCCPSSLRRRLPLPSECPASLCLACCPVSLGLPACPACRCHHPQRIPSPRRTPCSRRTKQKPPPCCCGCCPVPLHSHTAHCSHPPAVE